MDQVKKKRTAKKFNNIEAQKQPARKSGSIEYFPQSKNQY